VACGGFAAGRRAGRAGDFSVDSGGRQALGAQQQRRRSSSKCEQCHVYSRRIEG